MQDISAICFNFHIQIFRMSQKKAQPGYKGGKVIQRRQRTMLKAKRGQICPHRIYRTSP